MSALPQDEKVIRAGIPGNTDALPLTVSLSQPPYHKRVQCIPRSYSEIVRGLAVRELDAGLVPVIQYSLIRAHRGVEIIPDIGVVVKDSHSGVLLMFNRGLERIRRVAVTAQSAEHIPLMQILLKEKYDLTPEILTVGQTSAGELLIHQDAVLISGVEALREYDRCDNYLDLGEEWYDLTDGLPMVSAFWVAGVGILKPQDVALFQQARDEGIHHVPALVQEYLQLNPIQELSAGVLENHLSQSLTYELNPPALDSIREYLTYCYYYGLIQEIPDLHFPS